MDHWYTSNYGSLIQKMVAEVFLVLKLTGFFMLWFIHKLWVSRARWGKNSVAGGNLARGSSSSFLSWIGVNAHMFKCSFECSEVFTVSEERTWILAASSIALGVQSVGLWPIEDWVLGPNFIQGVLHQIHCWGLGSSFLEDVHILLLDFLYPHCQSSLVGCFLAQEHMRSNNKSSPFPLSLPCPCLGGGWIKGRILSCYGQSSMLQNYILSFFLIGGVTLYLFDDELSKLLSNFFDNLIAKK